MEMYDERAPYNEHYILKFIQKNKYLSHFFINIVKPN